MAFRRQKAVDGPASTEHRLDRNVSCFAFNGDRTQIALSPNDPTIMIYQVDKFDSSKEWKLLHDLHEVRVRVPPPCVSCRVLVWLLAYDVWCERCFVLCACSASISFVLYSLRGTTW